MLSFGLGPWSPTGLVALGANPNASLGVNLGIMTTNPNDAKGIELLETVRKKRAALEARLRKEPYRKIADDLGVSVPTVRLWVKEMTQTMLPQEEIEELRAQEADSLDASEQRLLTAIGLIIDIIESRHKESLPIGHQLEQLAVYEDRLNQVRKQRAQLLGIMVPVKVNHAVTVRTEFDAEVEELTSLLLNGGDLLSGPDQVDTGESIDAA